MYDRVRQFVAERRDELGLDAESIEGVLTGDAPDIVEADPAAVGE